MNSKYNFFLTIILFAFLIVSCKKDNPNEPQEDLCPISIDNWDTNTFDIGIVSNTATVNFPTSETGYISYEHSDTEKMIKTVNGGVSWENIIIPSSEEVENISFINENTGFISLGNKFYKTSDGGLNWDLIIPNEAEDAIFSWIKFFDENIGIAIQSRNSWGYDIVRTIDGGLSWNIIPDIVCLIQKPKSIFFSNNSGFIGTEQKKIIKVTNKGESWEEISLPTLDFITAFHFLDENIGFVSVGVPDKNPIYKTIDGGTNWEQVVENLINIDIHFSDENCGFIIEYLCYSQEGCEAYFHTTDDGGQNWNISCGRTGYRIINNNQGIFINNDVISTIRK